MKSRPLLGLLVLLLSSLAGTTLAQGRTVVVWLSVDGMRGDYVDRFETPFLRRLMKEGAFTKQLVPVFPSLTFPSHVSEATGVKVERHGIPGNAFHDTLLKQDFSFPDDASLLQAEPIWLTASRQGVRAGVASWPMSYAQRGEVRSAYFSETYPKDWSDEKRLAEVVRIWEEDEHAEPLRLVMGYIPGPDTAGHRFGPESKITADAVKETDALLAKWFARVNDLFRRKMKPEDRLYVLITTDHGMAPVTTLVNVEKLAGEALPKKAKILLSSTIAHVFLSELPEAVRGEAAGKLKTAMLGNGAADVYLRDELPEGWGARHPTRIGDVVVVCKPGAMVTTRSPMPVIGADKVIGTPAGMHGYPPESCPEMKGFAVIWRSGPAIGGKDLGEVDSLRWHPTVATLLGIAPAEGATAPALEIE